VKTYDSIDIAAPPEFIWPLLADPQAMAQWHEKLVSVRRPAEGTVQFGDRFETTYTMSGRQTDATAEVVRCRPPTGLTYRHHVQVKGRAIHVDESFDLQPQGEGTGLDQTLDWSGAGLPLWARALMWFISRFGKPTGKDLFEPLKVIAEKQYIARSR
jgi:uncharacterized protein YndB with AHSA1/START domain